MPTSSSSRESGARRRRRTPEEAREEILDAAEALLLREGPAGLQLKPIAKEAGLSFSNVHHHFGGVAEVQKALVARMLERLADKLSEAFDEMGDHAQRTDVGIRAVYELVGSERYSRLIAWLVLFSATEQLIALAAPLSQIRDMLVERLATLMPRQAAEATAPAIIHQVAVAALGEGLIGSVLRGTLGHSMDPARQQDVMLEALLERTMGASAPGPQQPSKRATGHR